MPEDIESLLDAFGNALVKRDHEALDVLLAPWIAVQTALEQLAAATESMAREWEVETSIWPAEHRGSTGALTFEDVRERDEVPDNVNAENFVRWCVVTLMPDEDDEAIEFDAYCDVWFSAVRLPDGLHVGSLDIADPD